MQAADDAQPIYSSFPSSGGFLPGATPSTAAAATPNSSSEPQHATTADFDAMKRSFEAATLANGGATATDKKQRYPSNNSSNGQSQQQPAYPTLQQASPQQPSPSMGGYGDVYAAAGAAGFGQLNGNGVNGGANNMYGMFGPGAAPFVPASQQLQQATGLPDASEYATPTSPYLSADGSPNPSAIPFGSPSSHDNLALPGPGGASSFPGSNYSQYDPTLSMPSSPNPYANPYASPSFGFGSPFMGGLISPMLGLGMGSPQQMQGSFGLQYPIMGSPTLGANGGGNVSLGRTVYVGNLPSDASVDELLSQVRFGPIESLKILPEKSCAFISFLDPTTAAAFHSDALMRKVRLHEQDLKIGWGKPSAVPPNVLLAVQQNGATRNVYLGNLDENVTEQTLRDDLSRFGPIDQVKIVRDKNIGFVHFLSIATAMKVVSTLATEPEYAGRKIAFGKDRTAYVPKNQHQQQQHNLAAAAMGSMAANYGGFNGMGFASPNVGSFSDVGSPNPQDANTNIGNRTIYLGNIHPETTTEEICNTIRGGILQQIRYIPDKHICFVTFVDPHCALAFYQTASFQGITLHNRRLKVGWGKASGPTSPGIAMVVQAGGSRNVYVGNIEDFDTFTEEKIRADFGEYGEIELVNTLKEKNCCFVNFTNIANSIKSIEGMKSNPEYSQFKISYGKDRCGGAPRSFRGFDMHHQGGQRSHQGNGQRSPFQNGMAFPDMGSPIPLEAFDPTTVASLEYSPNPDASSPAIPVEDSTPAPIVADA